MSAKKSKVMIHEIWKSVVELQINKGKKQQIDATTKIKKRKKQCKANHSNKTK